MKLLLEYLFVAITIDEERLDAVFAALADRTRRDIVASVPFGTCRDGRRLPDPALQ